MENCFNDSTHRFCSSLHLVSRLAQTPSTPAKSFTAQFEDTNRRLLAMAKDFPEDKYGYRATKDVRSFGEIIVHVASGNAYAAKAGRAKRRTGMKSIPRVTSPKRPRSRFWKRRSRMPTRL